METNEESPLLKSSGELSPRKQIPFLRAALLCGSVSFLVAATIVSSAQIITQYIHARLVITYGINVTTEDGDSSCSANKSTPEEDPLIKVQQDTSNYLLLFAITNSIPAVFINVLLGSHSDNLGRKIMFIIPTIGLLLRCTFSVFIMYFEMDVRYFFIAYGLDGLGGSTCAILVASFAYTADITSSGRGRVLGVTLMEITLAVAACVANLLTGFLIPALGYFPLYIIITSLMLVTCGLIILMPETIIRGSRTTRSLSGHFKNVFGFYFTKEKNKHRNIYILLMGIFIFGTFVLLGRLNIETLYMLDEPFCWDSIQIGFFGAVRIAAASLGTILGLKILQKCIRDEAIALLGALSSVASFILEGLATSGLVLYLVAAAGVLSTATIAVIRGCMSRMTSPAQQGAMFAGIGFVEAIMTLLCQVIYNSVYSATVVYMKGAVFLVMAGLLGIAAILTVVLLVVTPRATDLYTVYIPRQDETKTDKHECNNTNV